MAGFDLTSFFKYTLYGIFIFLCMIFATITIIEPWDTNLDPYFESSYGIVAGNLTELKNTDTPVLLESAQTIPADADAVDLEGNFLVNTFKVGRDAVASSNALIKVGYDMIPVLLERFKTPQFILGLIITLLTFTLLVILLKIGITRTGI